jgi:hypothetical protein
LSPPPPSQPGHRLTLPFAQQNEGCHGQLQKHEALVK